MIEIRREAGEVSDREIESLLHRVYGEGGFTERQVAERAFAAAAVRARGELWAALSPEGQLVGLVALVLPTAPGRRIAREDEAELHLLAVAPEYRSQRIGRRLVEVVIARARELGQRRLVLWTQPSMHAAQALYESLEFVRCAERDAELPPAPGRSFWVYERALD